MKRVLIMACSERKDPAAGEIPAFQRYDGPAWRTYRAALRELPVPAWPTTFVLSAELGLFGDSVKIPDYNRRMDKARAAELAGDAAQAVKLLTILDQAEDLFIFGGELYRDTLWKLAVSRHLPVDEAMAAARALFGANWVHGRGIGDHLAQLRAWLYRPAP